MHTLTVALPVARMVISHPYRGPRFGFGGRELEGHRREVLIDGGVLWQHQRRGDGGRHGVSTSGQLPLAVPPGKPDAGAVFDGDPAVSVVRPTPWQRGRFTVPDCRTRFVPLTRTFVL